MSTIKPIQTYRLGVSRFIENLADTTTILYNPDSIQLHALYGCNKTNIIKEDGSLLFEVGKQYYLVNHTGMLEKVFDNTPECFAAFIMATVWESTESIEPLYKFSDLRKYHLVSNLEQTFLTFFKATLDSSLGATLPKRYDLLYQHGKFDESYEYNLVRFLCGLDENKIIEIFTKTFGQFWIGGNSKNLNSVTSNALEIVRTSSSAYIEPLIKALSDYYKPVITEVETFVDDFVSQLGHHNLYTSTICGGELLVKDYGDYRILEWERMVAKNSEVGTMIEKDIEFLSSFV